MTNHGFRGQVYKLIRIQSEIRSMAEHMSAFGQDKAATALEAAADALFDILKLLDINPLGRPKDHASKKTDTSD
jgi:hypothetical protein